MSRKLLGKSFDIHGGGLDLLFPHHENELSQCRACDGPDASANIWMHNEMLQVEGKKMSKSLGNFFTVRDLLEQGVPGEVIRFVMLSTHYRKPMDWTEKKREEAEKTLRHWAELATGAENSDVHEDVLDGLSDDLNTPEAITVLHELAASDNRDQLVASAMLLGFDLKGISKKPWAMPFSFDNGEGVNWFEGDDYQPTVSVLGWGGISEDLKEAVLKMVRRWMKRRREKDWQRADQIKERAMHLDIELRGYKSTNGINGGQAILKHNNIDPSKLEALK